MDKTKQNQEWERRHRDYELEAKEILEGKGQLTNLIYLTVTSFLLIGISSVWFYIEFNPEWGRDLNWSQKKCSEINGKRGKKESSRL